MTDTTDRAREGNVAAAIEAGRLLGAHVNRVDTLHEAEGSGVPFVVLQDGMKLHRLEQWLPAPTRKRGTLALSHPASLIDYVKQHAGAGTRIFADPAAFAVTAVLDHHQDDRAGWGEHRAALQLIESPSWKAWVGNDRKNMGQEAFGEFLEDHIADIAKPDGAALIEACTSLRTTTEVQFHSAVRLSNGQAAFSYEEADHTKGGMTVPQTLTLAIPPWDGLAPVLITARLRWRIDRETRKLAFRYHLDQAEEARRHAFAEQVVTPIGDGLGRPILFGRPG